MANSSLSTPAAPAAPAAKPPSRLAFARAFGGAEFRVWKFCGFRFFCGGQGLYSPLTPLSTAATSIPAVYGVLALFERKIDDASGDTSEIQRARSDPSNVKNCPKTANLNR